MFIRCCARYNKKNIKSKSTTDLLVKVKNESETINNTFLKNNITLNNNMEYTKERISDPEDLDQDQDDNETAQTRDSFENGNPLIKQKRDSLELHRNPSRRVSLMDGKTDSITAEELSKLEDQLMRTNVDAKASGRRKSVGILKSTTSYEHRPSLTTSFCGLEDDEVFNEKPGDDGNKEPPDTPIGRDELALRRHRFFSELVSAARAAVEHRVRFDPLGPLVADANFEGEALLLQSRSADLESLLARLERVTERLERLPLLRLRSPPPTPPATPPNETPPGSPPQQSPPPTPPPGPPEPPEFSEELPDPLEELPEPTEDLPESPQELEADLGDKMSVAAYEDLVQGPLQTYISLSQKIGGDVAQHANLVKSAFQAQSQYIKLAASRGKPGQSEEVGLLAPTSQQIAAIQQFREKNRTSSFFNHLSAVSESIPALGWVAVSPTPAPYVKEMNDAGQFYTNRVLKEWKEKDKTHVEWCRSWVQLLTELQAYVKQHHTTGLVWSGKGSGGIPPPPPPGGLPPPPPMPLADFDNMSVDDRSALFAQINQGENITSHLKKVTSEMQTHKNPSLRQGPAPFKAAGDSRAPAKALPQPGAPSHLDKPPVFMRDGKKWLIEYQKGNTGLVVEGGEISNVVYMFRCRDSALTVRGKINGVVLDSCTKCALVFDNLVSGVEIVNCQSVQMQVLGKVPTITVDKTDGCQMYLSPESLDVEVVSCKSSEMNVLVPKGNGDYTEYAVPEQFKTKVKKAGTGLVTEAVENKG